MPTKKCVILVPYSGAIVPGCEQSLRHLEEQGYPVWRVPGFSQIDVARSQLATDAMEQGFEETVWIDSDVEFEPASVSRLRDWQLPIVCGIYPKKSCRELAIHVLPGTKQMRFGSGGGLHEILYAAAGFLYVHRSAYEQIQERCQLPTCNMHFRKPLVPYFQPLVRTDFEGGPWYLGEDFAFCERARMSGIKIWADTTIRLWHVGSFRYGWEDAGRNVERYGDYQFSM